MYCVARFYELSWRVGDISIDEVVSRKPRLIADKLCLRLLYKLPAIAIQPGRNIGVRPGKHCTCMK